MQDVVLQADGCDLATLGCVYTSSSSRATVLPNTPRMLSREVDPGDVRTSALFSPCCRGGDWLGKMRDYCLP